MTEQEIEELKTAIRTTPGRESWTEAMVNEYARGIIFQRSRKVHAVKFGADKWSLGKAMCGCTISRYTPTSREPENVTCPRCRKKIAT